MNKTSHCHHLLSGNVPECLLSDFLQYHQTWPQNPCVSTKSYSALFKVNKPWLLSPFCLPQCAVFPLASPSPQQTAKLCQEGMSTLPVWQWVHQCRMWSGCWEPKTWRRRMTCPSAAMSWSWPTCGSPTITHVSPCPPWVWLRPWHRLLWKVGWKVFKWQDCTICV